MQRGFQTSWTPGRAQVQEAARRVRVRQEQKAEAAAGVPSGIATGGAGGASLTSRYVGYYASLPPEP